MRFVIVSCIWKRPQLTEIFLKYYKKLADDIKDRHQLILLAVGSEGEFSKNLCLQNDFHYIEHPNRPLSQKWNVAVKASKEFNPDAIIILGSDDFVSKNLFDVYAIKILNNNSVIGLKDMYILDSNLNKLFYWSGYSKEIEPERHKETIGMARCINRVVLDKLEFDIWGGVYANRSMDSYMSKKFLSIGIDFEDKMNIINGKKYSWNHKGYLMEDLNITCIDVKTTMNMNSVNKFMELNKLSIFEVKNKIEFLQSNFDIDYYSFINKINQKYLNIEKIVK